MSFTTPSNLSSFASPNSFSDENRRATDGGTTSSSFAEQEQEGSRRSLNRSASFRSSLNKDQMESLLSSPPRSPTGKKPVPQSKSYVDLTSIASLTINLGDKPLNIPTVYRPQGNLKEGREEGERREREEEDERGPGQQQGRRTTNDISKMNGSLPLEQTNKLGQRKNSNNNLGDIKLEDLVPTRRISRENSEKNSNGMAAISEDLVPTRRILRENGEKNNNGSMSLNLVDDKIETAYKNGDMREATSSDEEKGSRSPSKDLIGQWRKRELRLQPLEVDFSLGVSETKLGAETDIRKEGGEGERLEPLCFQAKSSSPKLVVGDGNRRSQFVQTQYKSMSGGTGQTQTTSSSSLFSSRGSLGGENANPAAATAAATTTEESSSSQATAVASNNKGKNFEVIKEEEKDHVECVNERRELASGDSFVVPNGGDMDGNVPGFSTYRRRRSGRIKKLRNSIRNSLRGTSSSNGNSNNSRGGGGEHHALHNEGGSQGGGSTISAEQQGRVSQHLHRQGSTRSITSAFSSFSAITGNSDASSRSNASGRGTWQRFRLRGGRPRMAKAQSNHEMKSGGRSSVEGSSSSGHSSRQILINHRQPSVRSQISNLSSHMSSDDDRSNNSAFTGVGRFTDFYDNNDHVRAVSSLISSKAASGRSLVSSLATVEEPSGGEQKQDEDYHNMRDIMSNGNKESSAYQRMLTRKESSLSDDSQNSFYRHPSHEHPLVHMRPNQLFPDSPGWQCDECSGETFDLNVWAYVSTEKNYLLCDSCFNKSGFSVAG